MAISSPSLTKKTLRIFWEHSTQYPWRLLTLVLGVFLRTGLSAYVPLLYRDIVNLLSSGITAEVAKVAGGLVFLIFALKMIQSVSWRAVSFVNSYFQAKVMYDLMNTCYQYLQKHAVGFFNSSFVGSLVTKVKRYERSFEQIADQMFYDLGHSLLEAGIIIGVLVWQYTTLGFIMVGWSIFFFVFTYYYSLFKLPYDMQRAQADTQTTAQLADSITNNVNIKLFTNYGFENERFRDVTHEQFAIRKKSWDLGIWGDLIQSTFMTILEFVIMYLAVKMWFAGTLTVGDIALFQVYLVRIFDKLWNTGKNIKNVYEALADANEMTHILSLPHAVQDAPRAETLAIGAGESGAGAIEFRNVSFGYHDEAPVLDHFNLRIAPGERVALIGPSGGGKSTIVKLLFRFHDIQKGEILFDGQNIARVTQDSLRAALSLVPQEAILFHRSLMENIRYARPDASDEEVVRAATLAHAHEFIVSFSQGYETLVGERGVKLSGGERQRVAIARAILKDAAVLVLDEATSSLDSESEMFIQDALKKLMQGRTTIVIAHRLSTIMQMDRIVVVDGGTIIEEGKHEELLKVRQGVYQKLWGIQAGGFAAA